MREDTDIKKELEKLKRSENRNSWRSLFILLVPVLSITIFIVYSVNKNQNKEKTINAFKQANNKLDSLNQDLKKITYSEFSGLEKPEENIDDSSFYQMLMADARIKYLDTMQPGKLRDDIVIRYYPKKIDGNIVYNLNRIGYYIHERPPSHSHKDLKSNIIYYGDSVDVFDIQLVALSLIRSGLPLKRITPFPKGDWRYNAIQIESSKDLDSTKSLRVQDIIEQP